MTENRPFVLASFINVMCSMGAFIRYTNYIKKKHRSNPLSYALKYIYIFLVFRSYI